MASLNEKHQRLVYLITYSRANAAVFDTRKSFADAVIEAWKNAGVRLQHWVVSMEGHATTDSVEEMNQYHYHMAVKLTKKARWLQIRNYLDQKFGIKVNFSDIHNTYYSAYRYVTKEDQEPYHSQNHPDLSTRPRTENAIAARKRKSGQPKSKGKKKNRRERGLTIYEVSQVIEKKNITKRAELVCFTQLFNKNEKAIHGSRNLLPTVGLKRSMKRYWLVRNFEKPRQYALRKRELKSFKKLKAQHASINVKGSGWQLRWNLCVSTE